jgi:hypothetical protein
MHGQRQVQRAADAAEKLVVARGQRKSGSEYFLAKNLLGYRDYVSNELSGPDGGPIKIEPAPELGALSDDEIKQLAVLVGKAKRPRKG